MQGLRGAAEAFALPIEATRLLLRERSLWPAALLPFLISMAALTATLGAVVHNAGDLYAFVGAWLPVLTAERWFEWLWIGPAQALLHGVAVVLFLLAAATGLLIAYLIASLLAAPFHEALSRRVESMLSGRVLERSPSSRLAMLTDGLRCSWEELQRLSFFLLLQGAIGLAGMLIPLGGLLAAPAMTLVTLFFLPLDYASYLLDRRGVFRFRDKRRWVWDHAPSILGFGAAAFAICLVPGLNLVAMPVLVIGATMLALRHPPALSQLGAVPRSGSGISTSP